MIILLNKDKNIILKSKQKDSEKKEKELVRHSSNGVQSTPTINLISEEKAKEKNDIINIIDRQSVYFREKDLFDSVETKVVKASIKSFNDIYKNERLYSFFNGDNAGSISYRSIVKVIEIIVDKNLHKSIIGIDRDSAIIECSLHVINKILENVTIVEDFFQGASAKHNSNNIIKGSIFIKFILDMVEAITSKYRKSMGKDSFLRISSQIKRAKYNVGNFIVNISKCFSLFVNDYGNDYKELIRSQSYHNVLNFSFFHKNSKIFSKLGVDTSFIGLYEFMLSESSKCSGKVVDFVLGEINNFERSLNKSKDYEPVDLDVLFFDMYNLFKYSFGGVLGCDPMIIDEYSSKKRGSELLLSYADRFGIEKLQNDMIRIFSFFSFVSKENGLDKKSTKDFVFVGKSDEWTRQLYSIIKDGINTNMVFENIDPFFSFFSLFGTHNNDEIRKFSFIQMISSGIFESLLMSFNTIHLGREEVDQNMYYDFGSENGFSFVLKNEYLLNVLFNISNAIYTDVQSFFEKNGKDIGVFEKDGVKVIKLYRPMEGIVSTMSNFSSWTYDIDVAKSKGKIVIECDVPVEKIILSSFLYPSMWTRDEKEQYVFASKGGTSFPWSFCKIIY